MAYSPPLSTALRCVGISSAVEHRTAPVCSQLLDRAHKDEAAVAILRSATPLANTRRLQYAHIHLILCKLPRASAFRCCREASLGLAVVPFQALLQAACQRQQGKGGADLALCLAAPLPECPWEAWPHEVPLHLPQHPELPQLLVHALLARFRQAESLQARLGPQVVAFPLALQLAILHLVLVSWVWRGRTRSQAAHLSLLQPV